MPLLTHGADAVISSCVGCSWSHYVWAQYEVNNYSSGDLMKWTRVHHRAPLAVAGIILIGFLPGACSQTKILSNAGVLVTSSQWTRFSTAGLRVRGRIAEVCFRLPQNYTISAGSPGTIKDASGKPVSISARFIAADESAVSIGSPVLLAGNTYRACFEDRNDAISREFTAIELLGSDTLTIREVTWWSGNRHGFL